MRTLITLLVLISPGMLRAQSEPAAPATTRPASRPPATKPSIDELHVQAVQLMRQGQWNRAAAPMAQVYKAKPVEEQPRAVLLNQAILDVRTRVNAVRAVRDLTRYLTIRREPDELATNVLGSALDVIADRPNMRKNPIFLEGVREWERRNYELESTRPDGHRWGTEWLSQEEFERLERNRREAQRRVDDQQARVDRANYRYSILVQSYDQLIDPEPTHRHANDWRGGAPGYFGCATCVGIVQARQQARKLGPDINAARQELAAEQKVLAELQNQFPKPYWPTEYEPIEPE